MKLYRHWVAGTREIAGTVFHLRVRPLAWTVWTVAPFLMVPFSGLWPPGAAALLVLWVAASLCLVADPSRVSDDADPESRRLAAKIALWLFGLVAAYVAWLGAVDLIWKWTAPSEPSWRGRLVWLPGDLGLAISLFAVLSVLAPAAGVFALSQRRFLARPESVANRLLLFLGLPALVLVTAKAVAILIDLTTVV